MSDTESYYDALMTATVDALKERFDATLAPYAGEPCDYRLGLAWGILVRFAGEALATLTQDYPDAAYEAWEECFIFDVIAEASAVREDLRYA